MTPSQLLLAFVRPGAPPDTLPTGDWAAAVELAEEHRLVPLFYDRLAPHHDALPRSPYEQLRQIYGAIAAELLVYEIEQRRIVAAFRDGPPLLLHKGLTLTQQLYGDPALRPTSDIDLLVHPADLGAARERLAELGWEQQPTAFDTKNLHLWKPSAGMTLLLELHWTTMEEGEFELPEDVLWSETEAEGTIHRFTPEMTLLHLLLHAPHHGFRPYRLLVDVAHALATWHDTLDWARLVALAETARALPLCATVIALAHDHLGAPMPAHPAIRRVAARPTVRAMRRWLTAERLLTRPSYGDMDRYLVPIAAGHLGSARFVLRDLLLTPEQMRMVYDLPRGSRRVWGYYLLRPLLLVRDYLTRPR